MKNKSLALLLLLVVMLITFSISSCTSPSQSPKPEPEVEGSINTTATSDDLADLGNKIWIDANKDGIKQRPESGFAGIVVNLYKDANKDGKADGDVFMTDTTNKGGYYRFNKLNPDINYLLEVVAPDGYKFSKKHNSNAKNKDYDSDINPTTGLTDSIDVKKGRYFYWFDAALYSTTPTSPNPARVGDKIWLDANKDGIKQRPEAGLANISLNLWLDSNNDGKPDKKVSSTKTNSAGNYQFKDLNPSLSYYVQIELAANYKVSKKHNSDAKGKDWDNDFNSNGYTDKLKLTAGKFNYWLADGAIYESDIEPGKPASLGSKVWFDENRDGVKQKAENGMKGIKVSLFIDKNGDSIPDTQIKTQVTDERGRYEFTNLDSNKTYYVTIVLPREYGNSLDEYGFTDLHSSNAPNTENLPGSDWDNDIDEKTGFSGPIKLVPGRFNYWAADIGLVERYYHYTVRVFGEGYVNSSTSDYLCTPFGGKCYGETNDTLTAKAADGWELMYWTGKGKSDDNIYNVNKVVAYDNVLANFVNPEDYEWKSEISGKPYWSPDGRKIAISSEISKSVTIVEAKSGKTIKQLTDFYGTNLEWSKDSKYIAMSIFDEERSTAYIGIYNVNSGKLTKTIYGTGSIVSFSWSPDGTKFAVKESIKPKHGTYHRSYLKIYDARIGSEITEITDLRVNHSGHSHTLKWSPNSKYLLVFSGVGRTSYRWLRVWKVESKDSYSLNFDSHKDLPSLGSLKKGLVEWSPNSDAIFVVRTDNQRQELVKITVPDYQFVSIYPYKSYKRVRFTLSPNRKYLLIHSSSADKAPSTLEIRRVSDWQLLDEFVASKDGEFLYSSDWSPSSDSIVVGGREQTIMHTIKGIN